MDSKTRSLELEAWLIETTGEEMMANHLGPNWNRFNEEFGFYPNMSMTIADLVWQHQQAKVEGLQEEFAEDERFLKEQIKDKDSKISNLEYLQGMDKDLIQTLQGRSAALQDRVNELEGKLKQAYEDVDTFATAHEALEQRVDRDRSLIQFTQKANKDLIAERDELQKQFDQHDKLLLQRNKDVQELYDINAKHVVEKAGMQKRVDAAIQAINEYYESDGMSCLCFMDLREILEEEQALKGEG